MSVLRQSIKCYFTRKISHYSLDLHHYNYSQQRLWRYCSTAAISHPTSDDSVKVYSSKITSIVEDIAKLTLIEVADLNECLKKN
ncbi:hypothetical protein CEXT_24951 [Caerostris extrusa]|uniref:Uncharacterized protein n=1 Tax=Caerostris extrusa TaxID=172846 RepID=A0AAV4PB74_CAEEX|nr:hypothetical protein CEXT_24951 [Caerostris extrusa]